MRCRVVQLRASPATFHGLMDAERELAQNREPDLILSYLPADGGAADTMAAMAEVWPTSRRAGFESPRQFADAEITTSGCLQCFWFEEPGHKVRLEVLEADREQPLEDSAVEAFCRSFSGADAVLFFADGLRFPVAPLVAELRRRRASLPPRMAGMLAACHELGDGAAARVFLDTRVYPSACLALGFEGFTMDFEIVSDFAAASPIYNVTRAQGETVYEIDGVTAVDWYRRFFSVGSRLVPMPRSALGFSLMIEGPDPSRHRLCRTIRTFDEPAGAVRYWGDVREGEHVRLGLIQDFSLVRAASRLASEAASQAAFLGAFMGREAMLGERAEAELAELCAAIRDVPLAGAFTFGEIGGGADALAVHNQTVLLALLRERTA